MALAVTEGGSAFDDDPDLVAGGCALDAKKFNCFLMLNWPQFPDFGVLNCRFAWMRSLFAAD